MVNPSSPRAGLAGAATLVLSVVLVACSTGEGTDLDARVPASTVPATTPTASDPAPASAGGASAGATDDSPATLPGESAESTAPPVASVAPSVAEVPEVGVPGLDDDDAFCAAWSRFAGSFQVIAVTAAFGGGTPESVAELEVLASGTVADAYAALDARWPAELDAERDAFLDQSIGPFARRVGSITERLAVLGVGADRRAEIDAAWIDGLLRRDPTDPNLTITLADDLVPIVEQAAVDHVDAVGGWFDDESLTTSVETPLTDVYLASNCPDQGTLAGQDAEG